MVNTSNYTVYFVHVDPVEVRLNLEDEAAIHKNDTDLRTEVFVLDIIIPYTATRPALYSKYRHLFQTLQSLGGISGNERAGVRAEVRDENDTCTVTVWKRSDIVCSLPFPKKDWANMEEILLTHGFHLSTMNELKRTVFEIPRLKATYELTIRPDILPYMCISSPYEDKMPEVVACAGFCISEALEITEQDILRHAGVV